MFISHLIKAPNQPVIVLNISEYDACMYMHVKDNGVGMTPDELNKLFKPDCKFKKTGTNAETGTDLGLLLCKEFADFLKGTIYVESEVGKGTEFIVCIPVKFID